MSVENCKKRIEEIAAEHPLILDSGVDKVIRLRLNDLFLEVLPAMIKEFETHAGYSKINARTAHSIKGAAGFVNARRVWALAGELETSMENLSAEEIRLFSSAIGQAFEETKVELSKEARQN